MTTESPRRAIVPAAGKGTRMAALRGESPKELLSVGGCPMLLYALADLVLAGIREICIVIAPGKADIQRWLAQRLEAPSPHDPLALWWAALGRCAIHFAVQPEPLGLADAIRCGEAFLGDGPYVCHLPDNIFVGAEPATAQLLDAFALTGKPTVALTRVTPESAGGFGNCGRIVAEDVDARTVRIRELGDKGTGAFEADGSGWRMCGLSLLTPEFLTINRTLRANAKDEWDDVPVFQRLAQAGNLYGRRLEATCYDVGNPAGYERAVGAVAGLPAPPKI